MPVTVDFAARRATNLVYRDEADFTALVPGARYQLPEPCVELSLIVYVNGQALDRLSDNGFVVLSPDTFELKVPWTHARVLTASYLKR